jgi:hypothetical protein
MKAGKRGRDREGMRKKRKLAKWKGRCGENLRKLGYVSVDKFIDDIRGR